MGGMAVERTPHEERGQRWYQAPASSDPSHGGEGQSQRGDGAGNAVNTAADEEGAGQRRQAGAGAWQRQQPGFELAVERPPGVGEGKEPGEEAAGETGRARGVQRIRRPRSTQERPDQGP